MAASRAPALGSLYGNRLRHNPLLSPWVGQHNEHFGRSRIDLRVQRGSLQARSTAKVGVAHDRPRNYAIGLAVTDPDLRSVISGRFPALGAITSAALPLPPTSLVEMRRLTATW